MLHKLSSMVGDVVPIQILFQGQRLRDPEVMLGIGRATSVH
jgi:hypothetical protein